MSLVDEEGRLFGRVNVYDAAVVVLVVLAVAGGAVVLFDPFGGEDDGDETVTRYVTLDLGERAPAAAARVSTGDTDGGLTITDTYVGPADGEDVSLLVRVRAEGQLNGESFEYSGYPLSRGVPLDVETDAYEMEGEVVALDAGDEGLATGPTPVVVETEFSSTAVPVERDDTYRLGGRTVGTVTHVVVEPATGEGGRSALVGLSLETVSYDGRTYFGDRRLLDGRTVEFRTDSYAVSGHIVPSGNATLSEPARNRTVTVALHGVDPAVADGYEPGLVERAGGTTTARVTGVETGPTPVVGIGENDTVVEGDHPRLVDVTLTVELRVRETDDGLRFRTGPLRVGDTVRFDFETTVAEGTVTDIRT